MIIYSQNKLATLTIDEPSILNNYKPRPPEINWSCIGSVPVETAEEFAHNILALCEQAKITPQEVPPEPKSAKKKLVKIIFKRAEGPIAECVKKEFTSLADAQVQAFRWARTAPPPGKGYDKCDFTLVFEDGHTYDGRYDLQNTGYNSSKETISEQARYFLSYLAGLRRPGHFTDEQWAACRKEHEETGVAEEAREFLESYEI